MTGVQSCQFRIGQIIADNAGPGVISADISRFICRFELSLHKCRLLPGAGLMDSAHGAGLA